MDDRRHWEELLEQIKYRVNSRRPRLTSARNYEQPSEGAILWADARIKALEAAVEWALNAPLSFENHVVHKQFCDELRRRAGRE